MEEWVKQSGAFAVRPKNREFIANDPESAEIVVRADFSEERPLFALQEYVAYANGQIQQSKRWADKSLTHPDGKGYEFPWVRFRGDVRIEGVPPQPLRFELDRGRLLDLLVGHTIYNDPTVAIRELLQNAIDAVRYQHHLSNAVPGVAATPIGKVRVYWEAGATRELIIEDDGVGMDRDVIEHHLMSVGSSFYNTPQFRSEHGAFTPISRFGIGILTCFMISDDIEIVTVKGSSGHRVRMTSVQADYLLREIELSDPMVRNLLPHGTRVRMTLRGTVDLERRGVEEIVRHWVILPECEVSYIAAGKGPVPIGFKRPDEALAHYHLGNSAEGKCDDLLEFPVRSAGDIAGFPELVGASLELALAVRASKWLPERDFAARPGPDVPMVCIEGIRVAGRLPWFDGDLKGGPSALLSVRGARGFKTTVSRQGLEEDAVFDQVAEITMDLLFGHIRDDVSRISSKAGKPLSQAATAAKWLKSSLLSAVRLGAKPYDVMRRLSDSLQSAVVETVSATVQKPSPSASWLRPPNSENLRNIGQLSRASSTLSGLFPGTSVGSSASTSSFSHSLRT